MIREMEIQHRYLPIAKGEDPLRPVRLFVYLMGAGCFFGGLYLLFAGGLDVLPVALLIMLGSIFGVLWQSMVSLHHRMDAVVELIQRDDLSDLDSFLGE